MGDASPTLTAKALWVGPATPRGDGTLLQIGMELDAYEALGPGEAVLLLEVDPMLLDVLLATLTPPLFRRVRDPEED